MNKDYIEEKINSITKEICSISVAGAPKSAVRKIISKALTDLAHTYFSEGVKEGEKAAGYCKNCAGKGYSTVKCQAASRYRKVELNPYRPCSHCDRGKQIKALMEYYENNQ